MNTVELLEHAIEVIQQSGMKIRRDYLNGVSGGLARIGHQDCLFLDPSLSANDQLRLAIDALRRHPSAAKEIAPDLLRLLKRQMRGS